MKGTQHFSRMNYNVRRGLREIVAPDHRVSKQEWALVLAEFDGTCAYCGATASAENRGIVPDHLVAVTDFGELIPGNIVPACQTCNDSRGNKPWRTFLASRFPADAANRIRRIERYVALCTTTRHAAPRHPSPPKNWCSTTPLSRNGKVFWSRPKNSSLGLPSDDR